MVVASEVTWEEEAELETEEGGGGGGNGVKGLTLAWMRESSS